MPAGQTPITWMGSPGALLAAKPVAGQRRWLSSERGCLQQPLDRQDRQETDPKLPQHACMRRGAMAHLAPVGALDTLQTLAVARQPHFIGMARDRVVE